MLKTNRFFGACMGLGAQIKGCEDGPRALLQEIETLFPKNEGDPLSSISQFNRELSSLVSAALEEGEFPIIIGGDHSVAIGTWNGVKKNLKAPFTLIWIDSHLDSHTFETTPSNAIHGMPLAALLGYGDHKLSKLISSEPVLRPEQLILIGPRSYEAGEALLLEKIGVKIFWNEQIKEKGLSETIKDAVSLAATPNIGLSLDLDVIDPSEAPGVGSPEPGGISASELISALSFFKNRLCAFELVEYNPHLDVDKMTHKIAYKILDKILKMKAN